MPRVIEHFKTLLLLGRTMTEYSMFSKVVLGSVKVSNIYNPEICDVDLNRSFKAKFARKCKIRHGYHTMSISPLIGS